MNSSLERELSELTSERDKELSNIKNNNEIITSKLEKEVKSLQEEVRFKTRDLRQVRALSQMILDQRSDVEQFFLESLEHVKQEISKKKSKEKKISLPPLMSSHKKSG